MGINPTIQEMWDIFPHIDVGKYPTHNPASSAKGLFNMVWQGGLSGLSKPTAHRLVEPRQGHTAELFRGCTFMGALIVCIAAVVVAPAHPPVTSGTSAAHRLSGTARR